MSTETRIILYKQGSKYKLFVGDEKDFENFNIQCKKLKITVTEGKDRIRPGQKLYVNNILYKVLSVRGDKATLIEHGCDDEVSTVTDDPKTALQTYFLIFSPKVTVDVGTDAINISMTNPNWLVVTGGSVYTLEQDLLRVVDKLKKYYRITLTITYDRNSTTDNTK